jgi:Domain of unknown function (DUF4055)
MAPKPVTTILPAVTGRVDYRRKELVELEHQYELIEDVLAGERQVKHRRQKYLPIPNEEDNSEANKARYAAYLKRAVFYNVTARTLNGLSGEVFVRDPIVEIPSGLDILKDDATGSGVNLTQLSKQAVDFVLGFGRCGLLSDYPSTNGALSLTQMQAENIRPTIYIYKPKECINWRTIIRGGRELLSLVVLAEQYVVSDDGFEAKHDQQFRVLRLIEASGDQAGLAAIGEETAAETMIVPPQSQLIYQVEVWQKRIDGFAMAIGYPQFPTDASGAYLSEIPFTFIGARNNDANPDNPPLYDLAALNIAHYRNSADYEESCFLVGQPTPFFAGLTEHWVKQVWKNAPYMGSRAAVTLPQGATAGLLQAQANSMPKEAMDQKEAQMVALGAKLVQFVKVQRTATEANLDKASETSTLSSSAKNVSAAFEFALKWAAAFVGVADTGIKFELNTEFDLNQMPADERAELIKEWQARAITFSEMRDGLRKAGVADLDDEAALEAIAQEQVAELAQTVKEMKAMAEANPQPPPQNGGGGA